MLAWVRMIIIVIKYTNLAQHLTVEMLLLVINACALHKVRKFPLFNVKLCNEKFRFSRRLKVALSHNVLSQEVDTPLHRNFHLLQQGTEVKREAAQDAYYTNH